METSPRSSQNDGRFVTDPAHDAVDGARFLARLLDEVEEDTYLWKWATLAMFNLSHAVCVLALKRTWEINLIKRDERRDILNEQNDTCQLQRQVDAETSTLWELYLRAKHDDYMLQWFDISKPLPEDADQARSLQWLIETRNRLVHFRSETLIIDLALFPEHFLTVLDMLRFLVEESGNVCAFDDEFCEPLKRTMRDIERQLHALATSYPH